MAKKRPPRTDKTYREQIESYHPNRRQGPFHADPAKFRLLLGAWGAGKTIAVVWETIMNMLEYPGSLSCIFRKTYPALRDTTKADFLAECPREFIAREERTEGKEAIHFHNGSRVWFRCLDNWRKLGSTAFDFVVFDEGDQFEHADYRMVSSGRLRGKIGPRRMVVATNPPDDTHWLYKEFVTDATPEKSVHHFSTYDNAENLPDGYIANLEKMPLAWQRQFLHGLWGFLADGRPVYEEYQEQLHYVPLVPLRHVPIRRGWDFGWRSPACSWIQPTPTGHLNVLDELTGTEEDFRHFIRRVQQHSAEQYPYATFEDFVDIAGLQHHDFSLTPVQVMRRPPFNLVPQFRKLPLMRSIESIQYVIGNLHGQRPILQVRRGHCRLTNNAFAGGYYMDAKTGEPKKDGKVYEHLMDALRVAVAPLTMSVLVQNVPMPPIRHQRYAC